MNAVSLRARIDESAMDRLRIAALGSMCVAALAVAYNMLAHPALPLLQLSIVGAFGCCAAVHWLTVRGKVAQRAVSAIGTLMLAIATAITAAGFMAVQTVDFAIIIGVLMIAAGVLHPFRTWLLINLGMVLAVWALAGFSTGSPQFASCYLGLCLVAIIAIMIHEIATHYLIVLESLRLRDKESEVERRALQEQLFHSQKLESLGTLAGGVAHDMNNVLALVVGTAELIREQVSDEVQRDVDELLGAAERGAELTKNLLGFSRRGNYKREPIDVAQLARSVASMLRRTIPKSMTIDVVARSAPVVEGDVSQLTHALMNLCFNGADAMQASGALTVAIGETIVDAARARTLSIAEGDYTTIGVTDTGSGMPPEVRARIFEPFYTTKAIGKGTGLGLAMVYGTVTSHRGGIAVDTVVGIGTTFTLYLPASRMAVRPVPSLATPPSGRGTVLVIDDEEQIREMTCRMLERSGFRTHAAAHGREGLDVFDRHGATIDMVLLDMAMPVMGGSECFDQLRTRAPDVKILLVSGYAQEHEAQACLARGALGFLEKPYRQRQLIESVRTLIGSRGCQRGGMPGENVGPGRERAC